MTPQPFRVKADFAVMLLIPIPAASIRHFVAALILSPFVSVFARAANAQVSSRENPFDFNTIHVSLVSSGGISLGAYQAGVNWALLEVMRESKRHDWRSTWPRFSLDALAGASAGNINSLLAAIDYCHDWTKRISADSSLFFRTWMPVGVDQLMPDSRNVRHGEYGIVDRAFYDAVLFPPLENALQQRRAEPTCEVPIGASITRIVSDTLTVSQSISIRVSRHLGTYRISGRTDGTGLRLLQSVHNVRGDPSLGRQISLATNIDGTIRFGDLAGLVKAAHAVPYVFGPVELKYHYSSTVATDVTGCAPSARHTDGCAAPLTGHFADGGAIDNIPLLAGMRLLDHAVCPQGPSPDCHGTKESRESTRLILYVSPGSKRQTVEAVEAIGIGNPGGLPAALQLVSNIWGSASHYELQSLARMRAIAETNLSGKLDGTTRALDIVGEQFKHFAAFLGRSFREYDYFVGAYDGIHFMASFLCDRRLREGIAGQSRIECMNDTFSDLYDRLDTGCKGRALIPAFYQREHPQERRDVVGRETPCSDSVVARQTTILKMLDSAMVSPVRYQHCRTRDLIWNALCASNLLGVIAALPASLKSVVKDVRADCEKAKLLGEWGDYGCFVDGLQNRMFADPRTAVESILINVFNRAPRVEDKLGDNGFPNLGGSVEAVTWLAFSALTPSRRKAHWDPSSIPGALGLNPVTRLGWWIRNGIPNSIEWAALGAGMTVTRFPTWYLNDKFAVVVPLSFGNYGVTDPTLLATHDDHFRRVWYTALEGGLSANLGWFRVIDACSVSSGYHWNRSAPNSWSWSLGCELFFRKLRSTFMVQPRLPSDVGRYQLRVGLNDFNGILYWLFR